MPALLLFAAMVALSVALAAWYTAGVRRPGRPGAPPEAPRERLPLEGVVVAVDPGHGGADGGVSHGGVMEKDVNLAVARRLQAQLESLGCRVIVTREGDDDIFLDNRSSLNMRLLKAEQGEAQIFLSIHANSFPDRSQFGAQTFYHPRSAEGRRLALLIQEELVRLQPENYREALAADYYVLRNSKMPAVLIEVGFLSNPEDRRRLVDPDHQARLAAAIARAVLRFVAGELPEGRPTIRRELPPGFIQEIYPPEVR